MENRIFLKKGILLGAILSVALPVWIRGSNIQPGDKNYTWSAWLSCSKSCSGGVQYRARDVCPAELENNCSVIESRRCNEFSCDEIPSSSSPRSTVTTSLGTSAHAQKKFLTTSSSVPFTTRPEVPEVTTELVTTPLIKPKPKTVRSTTTTSTTTPSPKSVAGPKSGTDCLRSSFMVFSILLWHLS